MTRRRILLAVLLSAALAGPVRAACCYFAAKDKDILQPAQKAFIAWSAADKVEAFTVQPKFEGNALDFGMVIPTPSQPKLDEMPRDFFKDLAIFTILMPLPQYIDAELGNIPKPCEEPSGGAAGGEGRPEAERRGPVRILESGVVGSLDYKIIVAEDARALFRWLDENKYNYGGDEGSLDFYIAKRWFFTVMKIDSKQMKKAPDGTYLGEITPTRFTFKSESCVYPLKITQLSVKDQTDALFYVQSQDQMDLRGDLSWKHSFRVMWLTFMLGCSADASQAVELQARSRWVEEKRSKDPRFETTKLEWARKLTDADLAVLERPLEAWKQGGMGDLPAGAKVISLAQLTDEAWKRYEQLPKDQRDESYAKSQLASMKASYTPDKGAIVKSEKPSGYMGPYMWYPNREAPDEDVKGLSRLKGHLQKGQWLTKFRKVLRKDEMTDDLELVPVAAQESQEYVRIMPTSPP